MSDNKVNNNNNNQRYVRHNNNRQNFQYSSQFADLKSAFNSLSTHPLITKCQRGEKLTTDEMNQLALFVNVLRPRSDESRQLEMVIKAMCLNGENNNSNVHVALNLMGAEYLALYINGGTLARVLKVEKYLNIRFTNDGQRENVIINTYDPNRVNKNNNNNRGRPHGNQPQQPQQNKPAGPDTTTLAKEIEAEIPKKRWSDTADDDDN